MARTYLDAQGFAALPEQGTIDPGRIRFSQNSIAPDFKDSRLGSVADLARNLKTGVVQSEEVEPIRLVLKDGQTFTLDNRRLKAFQDAEVDVPYVTLHQIPPSQRYKFTTRNEGVSIVLRDR